MDLILDHTAGLTGKIGLIYAMFTNTRNLLLESIANLTIEQLDFTPDDRKVESIGTLLFHIAAIEFSWIQEDILKKEMGDEWSPAFALRAHVDEPQISGKPIEYYLAKLEEVRIEVSKYFQTIQDNDLEKIIEIEGNNCSIEWILYHVFEHELTHIGQIRLLKRLSQVNQL